MTSRTGQPSADFTSLGLYLRNLSPRTVRAYRQCVQRIAMAMCPRGHGIDRAPDPQQKFWRHGKPADTPVFSVVSSSGWSLGRDRAP